MLELDYESRLGMTDGWVSIDTDEGDATEPQFVEGSADVDEIEDDAALEMALAAARAEFGEFDEDLADLTEKNIRLFASEVMPHIRAPAAATVPA